MLVLMLVLVLGLWWPLRSEVDVVTGAPQVTTAARPAQAAQALAGLVDAVDDRDPRAGSALGDSTSSGLLGQVVGNAGALGVADFDLRYVDEVGPVGPDGTWEAAVEATWRFEGYDDGSAREEVLVGFRAAGDGVVVTSLGGGDRRTPLWFSGPLEVRRTPRSLVLVHGSAEEADLISSRAEAAVPVVRRVLPSWEGPLVLEVPESGEQLDALLDADPGTYASIAGVTATVDGSTRPDSPIHVFLNPDVYDTLEPIGAQVVVSHEATHVATDAPVHSLPVWLLEGFADYVALREVDLPVSTTAGQVIEQVRQDGPPDALPDQSDFTGTADGLGAAYEAAWLACTTLADTVGEQALVRTYQQVSDGTDLGTALEANAGLSVAELTLAWQQRLTRVAR